jgi:hypothetical protein
VLKESETKKYGEYRTGRLVLQYYRAWENRAMEEFGRWVSPEQTRSLSTPERATFAEARS